MIKLAQIVDSETITNWQQQQDALVASLKKDVPPTVFEFIEALAEKLGTLERRGITRTLMSARELKLTGWPGAKQLQGDEFIRVDVPMLSYVDHRVSMLRWYHKKGAKALVHWCRAHCKAGAGAEALIDVFELYVLKQPASTRMVRKQKEYAL